MWYFHAAKMVRAWHVDYLARHPGHPPLTNADRIRFSEEYKDYPIYFDKHGEVAGIRKQRPKWWPKKKDSGTSKSKSGHSKSKSKSGRNRNRHDNGDGDDDEEPLFREVATARAHRSSSHRHGKHGERLTIEGSRSHGHGHGLDGVRSHVHERIHPRDREEERERLYATRSSGGVGGDHRRAREREHEIHYPRPEPATRPHRHSDRAPSVARRSSSHRSHHSRRAENPEPLQFHIPESRSGPERDHRSSGGRRSRRPAEEDVAEETEVEDD